MHSNTHFALWRAFGAAGAALLPAFAVAACGTPPTESTTSSSAAVVSPDGTVTSPYLHVVYGASPYTVQSPPTVSVEQNDTNIDYAMDSNFQWTPSASGLSYAVSGLPAGVSFIWETPSIPPSYGEPITAFTVAASSSAVPGTYTVTITGTYTGPVEGLLGFDGSESITATIVVTAAPPPPKEPCLSEAQTCANTCGGEMNNGCGTIYYCPTLTGIACCAHLHGVWETKPAPHCLLE
jgi:hypothetical protein